MKPIRALLVYASGGRNATMSYQTGWPRQFLSHPGFLCTPINLFDQQWHSRLGRHLKVRSWNGDIVILLHSVFSNACLLSGTLLDTISGLQHAKAFFIGNEYKLMPEKMRFCEQLGISLLVTQTTDPSVQAMYRERLGCAVIGLPNTGFDPDIFKATVPDTDRPIDLGYRAADSPWYLGHQERREIAEYFVSNAARLNLRVDISLDPAGRLAETEWAAFLNQCKGQLGTEAGGDYFELTDATRVAVNSFIEQHPEAPFDEIRARFFEVPREPAMRIMSSRNIEAAGTRTVQLLFEGRYDGYFKPDIHYIPLKKDFSNVGEALVKFRDRAFAGRIADNALQLVTEEFTYDRLLARFVDAAAQVVS
jgi:hypothetical protein